MNDVIIRAEGISKRFRIGKTHDRNRFTSVMAAAAEGLASMIHRGRGEVDFWALKEISFEVNQGEALGVIGNNGAGKSTLLKILSRITGPTSGRIDIWGRAASLLEVGTGFMPVLSGRENVYLNGALLGMKRSEIRSKFDEIVSFAGVEEFIDVPVQRYSSGMAVRLAFSVAAHLRPALLIIDEVLAVGDQPFREKCLTLMKDYVQNGGTVLLVSHDLETIRSFCTQCLWLRKGTVAMVGEAHSVTRDYHEWCYAPAS